jgi:hypothetical protein
VKTFARASTPVPLNHGFQKTLPPPR